MSKQVEVQGRKEIGEAVLIAVLCGIATSLVQWGMDTVKSKAAKKPNEPDSDD